MKKAILATARAAALVAAIPLLAGEEGLSFDFKLHGGLSSGSLQKDHHDNKLFGFGVEGRYPLGGRKAITAELGYDVITARWRDVPLPAGTVWAQPSGGGAPVATIDGTPGGSPLVLVNDNSMDLRKEAAQGFSLRVGYTDALPWLSGLTWKAGLSLDAYKVNAEFTGTLVPQDADGNAYDDGSGRDYYEGWAISQSKTKLGLGAFAGVGVPLNENLRLEFNVRSVSTGHYDYHPFTYTGKPAFLEEKTRQALAFEIAVALKL